MPRLTVSVSSLAFLAACSSTPPEPSLGALYSRAAQASIDDRNPVIVIPGMLGSNLSNAETGERLWGGFANVYADPTTEEGLRSLTLPMVEGVHLHDLTDNVRPSGSLETVDVNVLGVPLEISAYRDIIRSLGVGGYVDREITIAANVGNQIDYGAEHYSCFQFSWDWRRDLSESAVKLHEYITRDVIPYVRSKRDGAPVEVDLVAHSMGGLVVRYYLMYGPQPLPKDGSLPELTWEGAQYVDRAILVGTPSSGSVGSLDSLIEGTDPGPFIKPYPAAQVASFPGVYQLLPRARHEAIVDLATGDPLNVFDVALWEERGMGQLGPDQDEVLQVLLPEAQTRAERLAIVRDHTAKCLAIAEQVGRALDVEASTPAGLSLQLVAGDAEQTRAVVALDAEGRIHEVASAPGDGTVTRASALADQRSDDHWTPRVQTPVDWDRVTFLFENHLNLTKSAEFTDNLLYQLIEAPEL
ncbi:MAG: hypothetical protein AAFZ65_08115 [Planctomycetota bacterium]